MHNFYIDEEGQVFALLDNKTQKYYQLTSEEQESFFEKVNNAQIENVFIKENTIKLVYANDSLIIDKLFLELNNDITKSFKNSLKDLKRRKEEQNIKVLKERFNGYIPTINRKKSARLGTLLVTSALTLSLSIPASLAIMREDKKLKTPEPIEYDFAYISDISYLKNDNTKFVDEITPLETSMAVELAFDDRTTEVVNNQGENKRNIVERNTSTYLERFIDRYGLPRNITYALCTQERGLLDEDLNTKTFCNPMQISSKHSGEYFKIPIYKDGNLTGEYDTFYVFSKEDPKRSEHPNAKVLIIEDLEDNFQIGCAIFWKCIDKYKNIFLAMDAYNKGLNAFTNLYDNPLISIPKPLEYYQNNFHDFSWLPYITEYYKEKKDNRNFTYGDPNYILNVLRYLETNNLGEASIDYYYKGEPINFSLINTKKLENNNEFVYNSSSGR